MDINESPVYVLLNPSINHAQKDLPATIYESGTQSVMLLYFTGRSNKGCYVIKLIISLLALCLQAFLQQLVYWEHGLSKSDTLICNGPLAFASFNQFVGTQTKIVIHSWESEFSVSISSLSLISFTRSLHSMLCSVIDHLTIPVLTHTCQQHKIMFFVWSCLSRLVSLIVKSD